MELFWAQYNFANLNFLKKTKIPSLRFLRLFVSIEGDFNSHQFNITFIYKPVNWSVLQNHLTGSYTDVKFFEAVQIGWKKLGLVFP